jgi:putative ABC transport system permease protein
MTGQHGPRRSRYPAVLRTQLAGVSRRPARLVMTGLSVLVAAFVAFATVIAHQMITNTILDTFSDTPPGANLVVDAHGGEPVSPATLAKVRSVPGARRWPAGPRTCSRSRGSATGI